MRKLVLSIAAVFGGALLCGSLMADDKAEKKTDKTTEKKDEKGKKSTWAVVLVGDEMRVIEESKIADLKKEVDKENKDAKEKGVKGKGHKKAVRNLKGHLASKEEAEKAKVELTKEAKDAKHKAKDKNKEAKKEADGGDKK